MAMDRNLEIPIKIQHLQIDYQEQGWAGQQERQCVLYGDSLQNFKTALKKKPMNFSSFEIPSNFPFYSSTFNAHLF